MTPHREKVGKSIIFIVIALVAMYFGFESKFLEPVRILLKAQPTTARLDNKYIEHRHKYQDQPDDVATKTFDVSYEFQANGHTYIGKCNTSEKPQPEMTIWYLPDSPSTNGVDLRGHAVFEMIFFVIPLVLFLAFAYRLFRQIRKPE